MEIFIFRNILWPSGSSQILVSRNIFVLLLILMVGSRSIHYSSFASHKRSYGTIDSGINLTLLFQQQCKYTVLRWASPRHYTVDPMLLPSGNPFKCHEEVLYLQSMIPPKRFDIFSPDWGMLRRSRCVHIFFETSLTRQCLERRVLIFLQTPDCVLFQEKAERA